MAVRIIKTDEKHIEGDTLKKASEVLASGGLVAFPTESFYGLGANANNEKAIRKLILAKERPLENPILLIIPSRDMLNQYVNHIPDSAYKLIETFWPGSLTLVFEAAPSISPLLTAGTGKIGIRLSSHPIARGLAGAAGGAITGTSANISGKPPCSTAYDVAEALGGNIDMILDGGETMGGSGSTVVDATISPPQVLREGMISSESLNNAID